MKIEIKNVKYVESLSEETLCFTATIYLDGKRLGGVSNRGCGGCHEYDFHFSDVEKMEAWCVENLPKWTCDWDDKEFDTDLEMHISHLVQDYLNERDAKKLFKKYAYFKDDDCADNEVIRVAFDKNPLANSDASRKLQIEHIFTRLDSSKNPFSLNVLPISEATNFLFS